MQQRPDKAANPLHFYLLTWQLFFAEGSVDEDEIVALIGFVANSQSVIKSGASIDKELFDRQIRHLVSPSLHEGVCDLMLQ